MKKIGILLLSILIISNIGYSEVRNINGLSFNDEIFGKGKYCKVIGSFYLMIAQSALSEEKLGGNNPEVLRQDAILITVAKELDKKLSEDGYNYSSQYLKNYVKNIDSYYKENCRVVNEGDIIATENKSDNNRLLYFFYKIIMRVYLG